MVVSLTLIAYYAFSIKGSSDNEDKTPVIYASPSEEPVFMTKDEVLEAFYNYYESFEVIAEYFLNVNEHYGLYQEKGEFMRNGIPFDIDCLQISEQIKLVCSLGFTEVGSSGVSDRVSFGTLFDGGRHGVIYVVNGLDGDQPLDKENWYYYSHHFET